MTIPRSVSKRAIRIMLDKNDCKKWIVGKEVGKNGYEHWQVRLQTSNKSFFDWVKLHIGTAHVEKAQDQWIYERKEGCFWTSDDNTDVLRLRFGRPTKAQNAVIQAVRATNDREVVVWYDPKGNQGKSWLCGHLWETGKAHYVPPTLTSVKEMIQTVASLMMTERREIIVIDIPRSWKWSKELYTAIETIKDGLIMDCRYSARTINVRGIKVLIMTNTKPALDALSADRWIFYSP